MLQTKSLLADIRFDPADLQQVMLSLSATDWKPALLESQRRILELAGVVGKVRLPIIAPRAYGPRISSGAFGGDVFFKDSDVYFLVTHQGEREMLYRRVPSGIVSEPRSGLEIGIITSEARAIEDKLHAFAETFQQTTTASLDGRKTRHMQFDWQESVPGTPRLDRIASGESGDSDIIFGKPELDEAGLQAAKALADERTRKMLIELSQAGFARAQDVLSRKGKGKDEAQKALTDLKALDLLSVEYLLECKRSGIPLTRLGEKAEIENPTIGHLRCAMCGKLYREENLSEGYSVSNLGRKLSEGSHWMTIWVTEQLRRVGVPLNAILWNLAETGEEVDLLVEFMGELWILELKDREFGSGDAHPLNYRQVRYKATKAIVITTDKVSKDARRVFEDLAKERSGRAGVPIYIEGLNSVRDALAKEVSGASVRFGYQKLASLTILSGYDFRSIIAAKFGEVAPRELVDDEDLLHYYR